MTENRGPSVKAQGVDAEGQQEASGLRAGAVDFDAVRAALARPDAPLGDLGVAPGPASNESKTPTGAVDGCLSRAAGCQEGVLVRDASIAQADVDPPKAGAGSNRRDTIEDIVASSAANHSASRRKGCDPCTVERMDPFSLLPQRFSPGAGEGIMSFEDGITFATLLVGRNCVRGAKKGITIT